MTKQLLFTYGTLADPEFFECLLNRTPSYQEAFLEDYQLWADPRDGYLFIKPGSGTVSGKLVLLSPSEIELIDLWEEVPIYQRELLSVISKQKAVKAFVYTRNNTIGLSTSNVPTKSRTEILEAIKQFKRDNKNSG